MHNMLVGRKQCGKVTNRPASQRHSVQVTAAADRVPRPPPPYQMLNAAKCSVPARNAGNEQDLASSSDPGPAPPARLARSSVSCESYPPKPRQICEHVERGSRQSRLQRIEGTKQDCGPHAQEPAKMGSTWPLPSRHPGTGTHNQIPCRAAVRRVRKCLVKCWSGRAPRHAN